MQHDDLKHNMVISNALLWAEPADILSPGKGFSSPDPVREKVLSSLTC